MSIKVGDIVVISDATYHSFADGTEGIVNAVGLQDSYYMVENKKGVIQTILPGQIKLKTQTKVMKPVTNSEILLAANQLATANNTFTTLEVKTALRRGGFKVTQNQVSIALADAATAGTYTYSDNGTYRVYSLTNPTVAVAKPASGKRGLTKGSATALAAGAKAALTRAKNKGAKTGTATPSNTISKSKALDMMKNSKGKFFTVEFIKKEDGSLRKMNCQFVSLSPLGYVLVKEASKLKTKVNANRNVNLQTLQSITMNGVTKRVI